MAWVPGIGHSELGAVVEARGTPRSVDGGMLVLVTAPGSRPRGERSGIPRKEPRRSDRGGYRCACRLGRGRHGRATRASERARPSGRSGAIHTLSTYCDL
jgi:hypothetical protein